jgi:hypothetical protein
MQNKIDLGLLLASLSIVVVIIGIIQLGVFKRSDFQEALQSSRGSFYFDKKFIPIMNNISNIVPHNESIVMSFNSTSLPDYFIESKLETPYGVYSLESLKEYMTKKDLMWLLVYENQSGTISLKPLFSKTGLKKLDNSFQKISEYSTEDQSKFHLYRLKLQARDQR